MSRSLLIYILILTIASHYCSAASGFHGAKPASPDSDSSVSTVDSNKTTVTLHSPTSDVASNISAQLPLTYKPFANIPTFLNSLLDDTERAFLASITLADLQKGLEEGEDIRTYLPNIEKADNDTLLDLGIKYYKASNGKASIALLFWRCAYQLSGDDCLTIGGGYSTDYRLPYLPQNPLRAEFWLHKALEDASNPLAQHYAAVELGLKEDDTSLYQGTPVGNEYE